MTNTASQTSSAQESNNAPSEEIATAYHEAGHAVMAVSLGRVVDKVTIEKNSLRLGQCQLSDRRGSPVKDPYEAQAMILFAGVIAESKVTGRMNWGGATQDLIAIRSMARRSTSNDKQAEKLQQKWWDKTEYWFDDPFWKIVDVIAKELIEKRSLSGRAVRHWFDQLAPKE